MFRTRWIRKLLARNNSLGRRCRQMTKPRKPVRLRLEALEDRVVPDATTLVAGDISCNFFGHNPSPTFIIPVTVNDNTSGSTATSGTVTISLTTNNTTTVLGSATVGSNGEADVSCNAGALPDDLQPGTFTLEETFGGSGDFDACNATGALTVVALSTSVTPISVMITANTTTNVTTTTNTTLPAIGAAASNFTVLDEGMCGDTLHIANSTINGNVGVGGTGQVQLSGPVTINGDIDFAGTGPVSDDDAGGDNDEGKDDNGKGDDEHNNGNEKKEDDDGDGIEGPTVVNTGDATVTAALNAVNALSASLAGLGTDISINGGGTINESAGQLVTVNGVSYRVFDVTSYHMGKDDVLTINGDGSGMPVVFNFGGNGNVQLGGGVRLTNGLTPDQVVWNFTGSGGTVHLSGDNDAHEDIDFKGIILAPNDTIDLDHVEMVGRVFGGDCTEMQINGNSTITAPTPVPTVTTTTSSFTVTVGVTSPNGPVTSGTVTVEVIAGNETIVLGSATLGPNGTATITVTNPGALQEIESLPPGTFEIMATFSGSPGFSGSNSPGTLTVTPSSVLPDLGATAPTPPSGGGPGGGGSTAPTPPPLSPIQAALELALDLAMLGNMNNPGSVGELEAFSNVFLGHPLSQSLPALLSSIPSLVPQAGSMVGPALGFASFLDLDLPIENPM